MQALGICSPFGHYGLPRPYGAHNDDEQYTFCIQLKGIAMKKSYLYAIWGVLYCACVGFSFIKASTAGEKAFLVALSLGFFVPPFTLVFWAKKEESRKTLLALRLVSISVLALTVVLLALNFLSVYSSSHAGLVLYVLLVMFTAPMVCSQYWVLSLFLWACLLMVTLPKRCPCQK